MDQLHYQIVNEPFVYPEFVVNGVPLAELLGVPPRHPGGRRTRLSGVPPIIFPDGSDDQVARLLLNAPPDLRDGRNSILVCQECGDTKCGVVSTMIERDADVIVWRDFASQMPDPTEPDRGRYTAFTNVPAMRFEVNVYRNTLLAMAQAASDARSGTLSS